jgi:hypothetical protein
VQLVEFAPEADDALLEFLREFLVLGCELVRRLEMLDELVEGAVALDVGLDASELPCDVLCARLVLPQIRLRRLFAQLVQTSFFGSDVKGTPRARATARRAPSTVASCLPYSPS